MNVKRIQDLLQRRAELNELKATSSYDTYTAQVDLTPHSFRAIGIVPYRDDRELCERLVDAINTAIRPIIAGEIVATEKAIRAEVWKSE